MCTGKWYHDSNQTRNLRIEKQFLKLQVGKTVHTHVARSMRTELWLSVLHRKQIGVNAAKQYREMLRKVGVLKVVGSRQIPSLPSYSSMKATSAATAGCSERGY